MTDSPCKRIEGAARRRRFRVCPSRRFRIGSGRACLFALTLLAAACGGSGGSGGDGDSSESASSGTITLSGTVAYERVPPTRSGGLDYGATIEEPVRGATIQTIDDTGSVVATAVLDESGRFSMTAPKGIDFTLAVLAQLGDPAAPEVVIRDNTNGNARYRAEATVAAKEADASVAVVIPSGWGGSGYTGPRAAAPFSLLDVAHRSRALVRSARPGFEFVDQSIYWSPDNVASSTTDYARGLIVTSHYNPATGGVYILGDENADTDEYDVAVVAHEWMHYFEGQHARSDSLGGGHGSGDILDETVAWGEGFATAMGGIINEDRYYLDTMGSEQGTTGIAIDLEADTILDTRETSDGRKLDGFWSELSVMELIWDIADGGSADDDALALGAPILIDTLLDAQADTPYFTSLYTFLHGLKNQPSVDAATATAIDVMARAENVFPGNEYDPTDPATPDGHTRYNELVDDGVLRVSDPDGATLRTSVSYGASGNKLLNRAFFRGTASTAGTHTIKLFPSDDSLDAVIWRPAENVVAVQGQPYEWEVELGAGELLVFAVEWVDGFATVADDFDIAWFAPGAAIPKADQ